MTVMPRDVVTHHGAAVVAGVSAVVVADVCTGVGLRLVKDGGGQRKSPWWKSPWCWEHRADT